MPFRIRLLRAHLEYRLLNEKLGLTPFQTLNVASIINSEATGFEKELGVLEKGKSASFLVFEKNPLESVESWATPYYVVKRGTIYSGEELRNENVVVVPLFASNKSNSDKKQKSTRMN